MHGMCSEFYLNWLIVNNINGHNIEKNWIRSCSCDTCYDMKSSNSMRVLFNRLYTTCNRSDVILDLRCEGYISWPMIKAWRTLIIDFYRLNKVFSTLYFCFSLTFSLKLYLFICIWSGEKKKNKGNKTLLHWITHWQTKNKNKTNFII